ncbi:metal-dependent hydrolase [Halomonas organivorans]|uniref:Inner membrane protein n=1 Tax=Halomonas organivorans TaxID=257772 RepID=A0A7W5BUS7_9GAMM|nr:metal-dependent hydrolase [Halomonas organivorans]MBB3139527.1 inner membrane protein [Halomonas organivorans]
MDSLTQAALGAAIGGTVLGRRLGRKAVLLGAVLGTLPDLDVVIDYGDAVANVTRHRGFSHSLFVLAGLAAALALLATRLAPARDIGLRRWATFFGLCLLTHPLLDALTTYGTQLWWPLDVRPTAYPLVFIIDPLYSLPLLGGVLIALITGRAHRAPAWGLALSCLYLTLSLGARTLVEQRLEPVLAERGLSEAPRLVQPTPFNVLLWRATVAESDRYHELLIGVFDGRQRPRVETFTRGTEAEAIALSGRAGRRLDWFAGPFLHYEIDERTEPAILVATDLRLGFPGFHPFRFALAERSTDGWRPLTPTRQLDAPRRDSDEALQLLGARLLSPDARLCLGRFVDPRWRLASPPTC